MTGASHLVLNINVDNYYYLLTLAQQKDVYLIVNKYCGIFAQSNNCGARETAISR
jgi:hypothetical protein